MIGLLLKFLRGSESESPAKCSAEESPLPIIPEVPEPITTTHESTFRLDDTPLIRINEPVLQPIDIKKPRKPRKNKKK